MEKLFKSILLYLNLRLLFGILLGAVAGYAYYYFIGCSSGTCAITSNPVNSTLYGVLFGGVLFYKKSSSKDEESDEKNNDSIKAEESN